MCKSIYLNWRKIESYNTPLKIVLGPRGMGKTFYPVFKHIKEFLRNGKQFIYLVDTDDSVKLISSNHGEKFFSRILEFMKNNPTNSNRKYYNRMTQSEITTDDIANKIIGGTIIINKKTAGYILSIDNFHKTKRNNFTNISAIIVDEFVPEKVDIRVFKNPYKLNNIIQSIARTDNVLIYMLGNTISIADPIIVRFGLQDLKVGEIRKIHVKNAFGNFLLGVAWKPDPKDYPVLLEKQTKSIAGLFSQAIGETDLESNVYKDDLPKEFKIPKKSEASHVLYIVHSSEYILRFHITKKGNWYVLPNYTNLEKKHFCIDKKNIAPGVKFKPEIKDVIMIAYRLKRVYFENGFIYNAFKFMFNIN